MKATVKKYAFVAALAAAPIFPWINLYNGTYAMYILLPTAIAGVGKGLTRHGIEFAHPVAEFISHAVIIISPLVAVLLLLLLPLSAAWLLTAESSDKARQRRRTTRTALIAVMSANVIQAALAPMAATWLIAAFVQSGIEGELDLVSRCALLAAQTAASGAAVAYCIVAMRRRRDKTATTRGQPAMETGATPSR